MHDANMILRRVEDGSLWKTNGEWKKMLGGGFDGSPLMECEEVDGNGWGYIRKIDFENGRFEVVENNKRGMGKSERSE